MTTQLPVVFLAFANDLDSHLATLKEESREIFNTLQPLENASAIAVHREESIEFDELFNDLLAYNDRIVIFHYAGHADGSMLQFEGGDGGAGGIASLLGQQSSLKLVFLNGCATKNQVTLLHQAGVPAVIATAVKISDTKASKLSVAFYAALADGQSIFEAFEAARAYVEGKFTHDTGSKLKITRHPNFDFSELNDADEIEFEFEWSLYTRPDSVVDLEQWRLPSAREGWQLQLEDNKGAIRNLEDQPIQLEHRLRTRTLDVLRCQQCGSVSSFYPENKSVCSLCGSQQTKTEKAQTVVPDLSLGFSISEDKALVIAASALGSPSVKLHPLYVPFWLFELDTRTFVTAERGSVKDLHSDNIKLEWETTKEQIDIDLECVLISAFSHIQTTISHAEHREPINWHWDIYKAEAVTQLDSSFSYVPLDVSVQQGFTDLVDWLDHELELDVADRVGGLERRNISTDRRYSHVKVRSICLPYWSAWLPNCEQPTSILINAQTGAVRFPQLPAKTALTNESHFSMKQTSKLTSSPSPNTSNRVSIYSGFGIGVMIGLLMGLAAPQGADAKSIVAIFIAAVGVGLAALLGLNDRHFSSAKGLRIGSFGLAVAISALAGIYVRDNGILSPSIEDRATQLRAVFPDMQDQQILNLLSKGISNTTSKGETDNLNDVQLFDLRSALFSADGVDRSVCSKLQTTEDSNTAGMLRTFRYWDVEGKLGWKNLTDIVEANYSESDQKAMLSIARDAACGFIQDVEPVKTNSEQCKKVNTKSVTNEQLIGIFSESTELTMVLKLINEKLSEQGRKKALSHLAPVLCSATHLTNN